MKRKVCLLLVVLLALTVLLPYSAYAEGDGNIDHGGGGINPGSSRNKWVGGDEGVRITVVRASDGTAVSSPIDFSNKTPNPKITVHFRKVSKLSYRAGQPLIPATTAYVCKKPDIAIPRIISPSGRANITEIKKYFCSEYMAKIVAALTGMDYDTLVKGEYKLLLEPFAFVTYEGVRIAMTATEAALYDQVLGGGLRNRISSTSHKNLPLSLFLERPDLGFPAWTGTRTGKVSNADIISALGLGIVSFKPVPEPEIEPYDYEYRVNTEVITAVTVRGGQADPDHPVTVRFSILGRTYTVGGVYYPDGDSQLVWVRWTTPDTPQTVRIGVSVSGPGSTSKSTLAAKIVDLSDNVPPNPVADDRNDSYSRPPMPSKAQQTRTSWGVWSPWWFEYWVWHSDWNWYGDDDDGYWEDDGEWVDEGWWEFDWNAYSASLSASTAILPDEKSPTASGKTMKSGYGINQMVMAQVSTNQTSAVTEAQTAVTYFPEFQYEGESFWRLLERTMRGYSSRFEFAPNEYSTYNRRTHFTPIWLPNGSYTPYTWLIDCWTPTGMLSMNLSDTVSISGSLWDDWHIAPVKP